MATTWGTLVIGRLTLREGFTAEPARNASTGDRTLTLTGEESSPPLTLLEVKQRNEDILGLLNRYVPVTFTDKTDHNGFYWVNDVNAGTLTNWGDEVVKFAWQLQLVRVGPANAVDYSSRLTGVARTNDFGLSGERWHAPAASAYAYFTGVGSQPSGTVARPISDGGSITVYRGVPASANPRWGTTTADVQKGRVRLLATSNGGSAVERTGTNLAIAAASGSWSLENALVRVGQGAGGSATLTIGAWNGTSWGSIDWSVSVTASATGGITSWDAVTVLRNDYELATVRLLKATAAASGAGRALLDLTLRRGSRFVEATLQTDASTTVGVYRPTAEAGTAPASGGHVTATANDGAGNRYIVISPRTFTAQTTQGGVTKAAVTRFDFGLGSVVGGSGALSGDAASAMVSQYLTSMGLEDLVVVR
jgi:hypothetical protein